MGRLVKKKFANHLDTDVLVVGYYREARHRLHMCSMFCTRLRNTKISLSGNFLWDSVTVLRAT